VGILRKLFGSRFTGERGVSGVEYGLIISLILVGSMANIEMMDERVQEHYTETAADIGQIDLAYFEVTTTLGNGETTTTTTTEAPASTTTTTTTTTEAPASTTTTTTTTTEAPASTTTTTAAPTTLPGSITTDVTYTPGVYDVSGLLTIAAGVTITLDTEGDSDAEFIFNIGGYLAIGAGMNFVVLGADANTSVVWNVPSGYVSVGAGTNIVGTVTASDYISLGAESAITGPGCYAGGAAYSLNSYVFLGADATIGSVNSCEH
jgi:Flp pilus assembly pilin Flp